jgi:hypothetical protein
MEATKMARVKSLLINRKNIPNLESMVANGWIRPMNKRQALWARKCFGDLLWNDGDKIMMKPMRITKRFPRGKSIRIVMEEV